MTFRSVDEFKKRLVKSGLVRSRILLTLLSKNGKTIFMLYCRELKNGQLNELSAKVTKNVDIICF